MTNQNFTTTFSVDQTPKEVFNGGQKKLKALPTNSGLCSRITSKTSIVAR